MSGRAPVVGAWLLAGGLACKPEASPTATAPLVVADASERAPVDPPSATPEPQAALPRAACPASCEATADRVCGAAPPVCRPLARAIACDDADALLGTMRSDGPVHVQHCAAGRCDDRVLEGRAELRWAVQLHGGVAGLLGLAPCAAVSLQWCDDCRNNRIVAVAAGDASLHGEGQSLRSLTTTAPIDADPDRDGFGPPDDACPQAAETYDGIDDGDGCPEPGGRAAVGVDATRGTIVFATPLAFVAPGGALTAAAALDLEQAAHLLRAHPRYRVRIHVTTAGVREAEVEAEARAIADVLAAKGVAEARIERVPIVDLHASAAQQRAHARTVGLHLVFAPPTAGEPTP